MRILISNTSEREGKVLAMRNTRRQSPQNIFKCYYNICAISDEIVIIFSNAWPMFENTIFLRVCGGLRG
jgi:hypothetical protein